MQVRKREVLWRALAATLVAAATLVVAGCAGSDAARPGREEPPPAATEPEELPAPVGDVQLDFERGAAALSGGRYSEAIPYLKKVVEVQPAHTLARYNLGVALQRVRDWQESVQIMTGEHAGGAERRELAAGVKIPVDADADYVHALGAAYQELRRFDQALACFDAAIALDRKHLKSRYARALALQLQGDLEAARAAWRDYIKRDPSSTWTESARKNLAEVESKLAAQAR